MDKPVHGGGGMRHQPPGGRYAAGTKIDSHRSRAELELLLARYGASDFVILEHDANATIRFALHGKYVQYVLPLPDPEGPDFTHTPTGRPRALSAQERAYEQAVRQQWRRAVLVMKGKLEAVESGLSPFEREFYGAIQDDERREKPPALLLRRRLRWAPETMLLILCLGVLVPAGGAVALGVPAVAVERFAAPAFGDTADPLGASNRKSSSKSPTLELATAEPASGVPEDWEQTAAEATQEGEGDASVAGRDEGAGTAGGSEEGETTTPEQPGERDAPDEPGVADEPESDDSDQSKPDEPDEPNADKEKVDKGDKADKGKDKGDKGKDEAESDEAKPPKPPKPPKDKGKNDGGAAQEEEPAAGGDPGKGKDKDKDKDQGAAKEGKGAGGAAKGKK